jgi:GNAT superfamily N-acetyltransferase
VTRIVDIHQANIDQFVDLYVAVFSGAPWNDGWSREAALERLTAFTTHPRFYGLGRIEGREPAALVMGWGERWVRGWMFHVKEMCVAVALQRKGFGNGLLKSLESNLRAENFMGIHLQTGAKTPARKFYESCGYDVLDVISLRKSLA